jgi:cytochrome c biogenesis protein CcmG/thiol:disulfide interchange protein DsbE
LTEDALVNRFYLPITLFVALLVLLGAGLRLNPGELPSPLIGKPAPAFALAQLHQPDKTISTAELAGRVWMLNVWASWCGACRQEHPVLMEFANSGALPIYGLDYKDAQADGLSWLGQQGNPYVASAFDADGRVGMDYGVYGVPETFVIDKRGVIRLKHVGPLTREVIERRILPLIKELNRA